jgi:glyoxylase-like metal-dependent hydrolase (beta-lactamase superfamily II)
VADLMGPEADWTAPGAYEVAPEVFRIPLPLPTDGLRAVNVYALTGGDGVVLVDSGWAIGPAGVLLAEALATLGHSLSEVRQFLVTHVHRDHYTQALEVRRDFGTPVRLGADERPSLDVLTRPDHVPGQAQWQLLRAHGGARLAARLEEQHRRTPSARSHWEMPDSWLADGEVVATGMHRLDVVHTPGHTRGHVVFHDTGAGLLFAGDHVLPTITPSIGFEVAPSPNPLGRFMASLAVVRQRPDALLLPAHGSVTDSAHRRIDELLDHHGQRLRAMADLVRLGAATAFEVADGLRWTRRGTELSGLDPFNQMLAVCETVAHLDLLVAQGRLSVRSEAGLFVYAE